MVRKNPQPPSHRTLIVGNYCHDVLFKDNTVIAQTLGGASSFISAVFDPLSSDPSSTSYISKVGPDFSHHVSHPPILSPSSLTTLFHAHFSSEPRRQDRVLKRVCSCDPILPSDLPPNAKFNFGLAAAVAGEILPETLARMLDICDTLFVDVQGLIRAFDPVDGTVSLIGLKISGFHHLLPRIRFLKASAEEAPFLELEEARRLCCVVVTNGEDGCTVYWKDGEYRIAPFPTVQVDPTGAGDSFLGGFVAGLAHGLAVPDAALLGNFCGSLTVGHVGLPKFDSKLLQAQDIDESKHGLMLYGFYETPPLDVEIAWSESHKASIQSNYRKEWEYFLNQGSKVDISYSVKSPSSSPLSLVIAQGRDNLLEWIEDPSYPNTTLSWNIIHGDGVIHQEIFSSKMYYIAVGNLNSEEVEVQLNFTLNGFLYNTTRAYYKCSLSHQLCSLKLFLLRANVAVLTSPGMDQDETYDDWYVKLSYGPRWITYFLGSGTMTVIILLAFRICNMFQIIRGDESGFRAGDTVSERAPLLSRKDDDLLSWGSSYDSLSHDEEEVDEWLAVASLDGKPLKEDGEANSNLRRLCVMCFDAPRDCFFLPCGHCAACFACGTRIIEEAGNCPSCRRTTKKVRKIFTV